MTFVINFANNLYLLPLISAGDKPLLTIHSKDNFFSEKSSDLSANKSQIESQAKCGALCFISWSIS